mmetsp:Transcript_8701/g.25414  ORF Transcript_8701/g.25414 Transcript_8701/m.25414 type:complete len:87 (+) Transcript_8701:285-545(+)
MATLAANPATELPADANVATATPAEQGGFWGSAFGKGLSWTGVKVLKTAEFIGEVVAEVLGLNQSEFQYVIDSIEDDKVGASRGWG